MRKQFAILFVVALMVALGCKKEDEQPCNCGTIANDGIDGDCYWLEIRNACSQNKKTFCFDQDVWQTAFVGNEFCVTDSNGW